MYLAILKNSVFRFTRSNVILLAFSVYIIYFQMRSSFYILNYVHQFDFNRTSAVFAFKVLVSLFLYFVIPALISKLVFNVNLNKLGVTWPKGKLKTCLLTLTAFLLLVPTIYLLTKLPSFKMMYTLKQGGITELFLLIALSPIYYFAEEFFFRGFLFLSLWNRVNIHSFWITDIIFTLAHIGKPGFEILLCIPASIVFNCLTLYTKSIYPALIVHTSMGILCLIWLNL